MVAQSSGITLIDKQSSPKSGSLFTRWVNKRLRISDDSVILNRNRIFILPTRAGIIYAIMLGAMLLFALNYNNSMIFLSAFLLSAVAINDIWQTHRNLLGTKVTLIPPPIALAGDYLEIVLVVESGKIRLRPSIEFSFSGNDAKAQESSVVDQSEVKMFLPTISRGRRPIPQICIATNYPLGLFRTWSYLCFPRKLLIAPHPAPREHYPLPFFDNAMNTGRSAHTIEEDEFSGLRPYVLGDPIRRIAWRASARSDTLVSKQFHKGVQDRTIWLRWQDIPSDDTETRLSVLCRWVLEAHGMHLQYGLSIPGCELPPGFGTQHFFRCLEALALFR